MAAKRIFSSPGFRFSIRQLLLGTALVAVACVALRSASSVWVASLLGLMLLALTAAVPLAIFRQGGDRAWWFGFALFGGLYILLLAYSWGLDPNTSQSNPLRPYSLVTAQISSSGYNRIYAGATTAQPKYYAPAPTYTYRPGTTATAVDFAYPVTNVNGTMTNATLVPANDAGNLQAFTFYFGTNAATPAFTGPSHDDFINVAHAFWTFLLAVCGGWFTCWVYSTRSPHTSSNCSTTNS